MARHHSEAWQQIALQLGVSRQSPELSDPPETEPALIVRTDRARPSWCFCSHRAGPAPVLW
ncbi:hypothetical protein [Streptomyces candidus]|uniref:Uncharacterized protein n=1 Tax=Streptomyces candidus TaxID=67283 RepID=A0A7X0HIY7_9ACTN|nr:hypothetical protein [Streptomyces candidus]MBB6438461.1 hypothetical protein [Streptomyces candidus]GHH45791.1 hypothetical protein GCM10018773_35920 [Streptomyces candidus]